jgi:hypothetical protein
MQRSILCNLCAAVSLLALAACVERSGDDSASVLDSDLTSGDGALAASLRVHRWGAAYCAIVIVTNTTSSDKSNWYVGIDSAGTTVTNLLRTTLTGSGNQRIAFPVPENTIINPGSKVGFGFCGSGNGRPTLTSVGLQDQDGGQGGGSAAAGDAGAPDSSLSSCSGDLDGGLIGGAVDPVSMPECPSIDMAKVPPASSCRGCHPKQFEEWSGSSHADAMSDRFFQALVTFRQAASQGKEDRVCVQCHSVVGTRSGDVRPGFAFATLSPRVMEGVSCMTCHGATKVVRPYNAGLKLADDAAVRGPLDNPVSGASHESVDAPMLRTSVFCATCHEVREEDGLPLERPFGEWVESPAAQQGQTCQDCHMRRYDGQAAIGGPNRTRLRSHRFVGFDPPGAVNAADPAIRAAFAADLAALLASAAEMEISAGDAFAGQTLDVVVRVTNRVAGHSLPTGSTFIRQCWLEVVVTDDEGRTLYQSGTFDQNGDLRDRWSLLEPNGDADLVSFSSQLFDRTGKPTLFPWEATQHLSNALRSGETRSVTYAVPIPADATGQVYIAARLRMRSAPPVLLRLLGLDDLVATDEARDLAEATDSRIAR